MLLEEYLAKHPKKYLIFDLDQTLADLHIDWSTIRQEMFDLVTQFDKSLIDEVVHEHYSDLRLTNLVIKKYGKKVWEILDKFRTRYEDLHYSGYAPNKELINFLTSNESSAYVSYIWTSNTIHIVNGFISKENLSQKFVLVVSHHSGILLKPEIGGFLSIRTPDSKLSEYLMIGDSINDEFAAKNAGIDFFKVDYFSRQ